ncbi:glycerol-3-phosphate 1-O-acyltransferase PlsY [Neomegalonema sp.]|uniref:glycerol-3-phosphate 1-O-acyltransferase PlsY n=1 Tax=Neomegalonema sp. TaxID=2039713 RepID=UPI002601F5AF|nr:glycerol-3-phosphate 1-O-acyltransferase PlsY [Neomegalonema sp.]MDD2868508.1 glycerol-3-phosphate 1-O-acyltransferase PlsY [Neomegalonema sp.]
MEMAANPGPEALGAAQAGAAFLLACLLGSIPFGVLLTRALKLGDLRKIGSGNIGATNVLRTGHRGAAAATLLLDALKGAAAVWICGALWGPQAAALGAFGALVGHCWPVWLKFRGGKGVATFLGGLLALVPWAGLAACGLWLVVAGLTRISSLSALAAVGATPLAALLLEAPRAALWATTAMAVIVIARHHENIRRLLKGEEPRIGARKS